MRKQLITAALAAAFFASAAPLAFAEELDTNYKDSDFTSGLLKSPVNNAGETFNKTNSQVNANTVNIRQLNEDIGKTETWKWHNRVQKGVDTIPTDWKRDARGRVVDDEGEALEADTGAMLDGKPLKLFIGQSGAGKNASLTLINQDGAVYFENGKLTEAAKRDYARLDEEGKKIFQDFAAGEGVKLDDAGNASWADPVKTGDLGKAAENYLNKDAEGAGGRRIIVEKPHIVEEDQTIEQVLLGHDGAIQDNHQAINRNTGYIIQNAQEIEQNRQGIAQNAGDIAAETERAQRGERQAEDNAKTYADSRVGDVGGAYLRDANGNIALDKNGKAVRAADVPQPQGKASPRRMAAAETPRATAKDYADAQRAEAEHQGRRYADTVGQRTLSEANRYTDSRYNQLSGKVKKLRARADSGVAGATAIAALPLSGLKANSFAGGLAVAKNKVAGAVGYQRNFNNNWNARAVAAVSDNYAQGAAGLGFSW